MSFIGNVPAEAYSPVAKDTFNGTGSQTDFTLSIPATTNGVEVFVENVQQEPTSAYTVSGTTLSFTAAPVSGTGNIYVVHRGPAVQQVTPPAGVAIDASTITGTGDMNIDSGTLFVDASEDRVGINDSSPEATLDVYIGQGLTTFGDFSDSLRIQGGNNSSKYVPITFGGYGSYAPASIAYLVTTGTGNTKGDLVFGTRNVTTDTRPTEQMRIESNGEVFMGTTSHYGDSVRLCLRGAGSNNGGVVEIQHTRNAGGGRDFIRFYNETGGEAGGIEHSSSTGVSYQTSSDYRLKENVVDLTGAISRVKQLPVRQFNFIGEDQTVDGFLAHEAQAVVPESASGTKDQIKVWEEYDELPDGVSIGDPKLDEEGNTTPVYQGIDQSKLVPLLTGALKEAIAKIETLETTVADLQTRVTALEAE